MSIKLKYHSNTDSFYDASGKLYAEPEASMDELKLKLAEAVEKLKTVKHLKSQENDTINLALLQHNLCSYIETLEWKIDLKLLHSGIYFP